LGFKARWFAGNRNQVGNLGEDSEKEVEEALHAKSVAFQRSFSTQRVEDIYRPVAKYAQSARAPCLGSEN
jgi:hypothetical protein